MIAIMKQDKNIWREVTLHFAVMIVIVISSSY